VAFEHSETLGRRRGCFGAICRGRAPHECPRRPPFHDTIFVRLDRELDGAARGRRGRLLVDRDPERAWGRVEVLESALDLREGRGRGADDEAAPRGDDLAFGSREGTERLREILGRPTPNGENLDARLVGEGGDGKEENDQRGTTSRASLP
jgi:hypothetical protein